MNKRERPILVGKKSSGHQFNRFFIAGDREKSPPESPKSDNSDNTYNPQGRSNNFLLNSGLVKHAWIPPRSLTNKGLNSEFVY